MGSGVSAAAAGAQGVQPGGLGTTERRDAWWLQPVAVALGLGAFGVYATWAAFQNGNYEWGPYLSPFYSPHFLLVHTWPAWWPDFLRMMPIFILWMPGGFRATCYYYRKAYYRAYFLNPPACAVEEARPQSYRGETAFPFLLQNLHRYFLYLAIVVLGFLWWDAIRAFRFEGAFGIGVGSVVLTVNVVFLSLYTFSCHSLRHLVGGRLDCFSCAEFGGVRHAAWGKISLLNEHHMFWAWMSLTSVGVADVYVRLVAMGVIRDVRLG